MNVRARSTIVRLATAVAAMAILGIGTAYAADPEVKCQQKKLKAGGKLQYCLAKNSGKVLGGKPDAAAACRTKFSEALTKAGSACRFLNNGDGTALDLNTGLVWEMKNNFDGVEDLANLHDADNYHYGWSDTNSEPPTEPDGELFHVFFYGLNAGTSAAGEAPTNCFANHCDWRLPTVDELIALIDPTLGNCNGGSGACVDPDLGPTATGETLGYWSITRPSAPFPDLTAWVVVLDNADLPVGPHKFDRRSGGFVRAVRGAGY